ncbi:class I SAM-dependent methyltransferase [Frondihabitans australicus]|uniref:Methyltransferase family protein n=1 Tax=Frondihabitans australicus TaxID=386892 RepID=A0A495IGY6_9MICO|nr:class I SAM-dependent methyltransferase [Frondihabitans australicus]RKR74415.1 methyltransferase family protein [Frondihabitans australicus]
MHEHQHPHNGPSAAHLDAAPDQAYWDDRYSSADRLWSGRANPQLIAEAEHLTPGRALDVGSGEGGDALWLASRGWQVTAIDLSEVALARAEAWVRAQPAHDPQPADDTQPDHDQGAGSATPSPADRISWQHRDILSWAPDAAAFDLVSSQYSHFPSADMAAVVTKLAAAVAPGGTLLVVGHEKTEHHAIGPVFFFEARELGGLLDRAAFDVSAELRKHPHRDGADEVLVARRRP